MITVYDLIIALTFNLVCPGLDVESFSSTQAQNFRATFSDRDKFKSGSKTNLVSLCSRPEKETSEDSDSSPPYLPAQPTAPEEMDPSLGHGYVRDVAV